MSKARVSNGLGLFHGHWSSDLLIVGKAGQARRLSVEFARGRRFGACRPGFD
jgi:hypothetical protein